MAAAGLKRKRVTGDTVAMNIVNPVANFIQSITLRVFADWRVSGVENVPPMGPLIVVANHQSNLDPSLLSTSFPRRIRFLAKEELFRLPVAGWLLHQYGAAPLDRHRRDAKVYRWVLDQLEHDQAIVLFPEGTRNPSALKKANPGVARLALKSQASLVPVGITGTERLGSCARVFNPTGRIRVNIGTPFSLPLIEGKPSSAVLESLTGMIMQRIAALLPPSYRGVYPVDASDKAAAGAGH